VIFLGFPRPWRKLIRQAAFFNCIFLFFPKAFSIWAGGLPFSPRVPLFSQDSQSSRVPFCYSFFLTPAARGSAPSPFPLSYLIPISRVSYPSHSALSVDTNINLIDSNLYAILEFEKTWKYSPPMRIKSVFTKNPDINRSSSQAAFSLYAQRGAPPKIQLVKYIFHDLGNFKASKQDHADS